MVKILAFLAAFIGCAAAVNYVRIFAVEADHFRHKYGSLPPPPLWQPPYVWKLGWRFHALTVVLVAIGFWGFSVLFGWQL